MIHSTLTEAHNGKCLLVDMGAFYLLEFAKTLCQPFVGSAVHGGLHVLQVVPQTLAMRMLVFPLLDNTFKVSINFTLTSENLCYVSECYQKSKIMEKSDHIHLYTRNLTL